MTFILTFLQHMQFLLPFPLQWQFFSFLLHCKILSRYQSDSKSICPAVLTQRGQSGWHRAEYRKLAADLCPTEPKSFPSTQGHTDGDSSAQDTVLFPWIYTCCWVRGKQKEHNRYLRSSYMPKCESDSIMHRPEP